MGWCTTSDHDRFAAAAGGYLRSRAAENTMLLSAAATVGSGRHTQVVGQPAGPRAAAGTDGGDTGILYGWWEPPDGSGPRGAFLHDPAVPLLIAGRTPEMAAALAGTLAKMGRHVGGVDAPVQFAGSAPHSVAGLLQVNAVVPEGAPVGARVPIALSIGGAQSQNGVFVAVR